MICPNCQSDNRDTAKFCDNCGTALPRICPNCSSENRVGAKFCDNCGSGLQGTGHVDVGQRTMDDGASTRSTGSVQSGSAAVFDQLVPSELAAKLEAARRSGMMEGERRVVTMLFCDVVGSTAASERFGSGRVD